MLNKVGQVIGRHVSDERRSNSRSQSSSTSCSFFGRGGHETTSNLVESVANKQRHGDETSSKGMVDQGREIFVCSFRRLDPVRRRRQKNGNNVDTISQSTRILFWIRTHSNLPEEEADEGNNRFTLSNQTIAFASSCLQATGQSSTKRTQSSNHNAKEFVVIINKK